MKKRALKTKVIFYFLIYKTLNSGIIETLFT